MLALFLGSSFWYFSSCAKASLEGEAKKEAEQFWGKKFVKCGNSHYVYADGYAESTRAYADLAGIYQFKALSIILRPDSLTDADKLNGIEWKGKTEVTAKVSRHYNKNRGGWQEWKEGISALQGGLTALMMKKGGRWTYEEPFLLGGLSKSGKLLPIKCSNIPPEK